MLNKEKKKREVLHSSHSARSCKTSDREEDLLLIKLKALGCLEGQV